MINEAARPDETREVVARYARRAALVGVADRYSPLRPEVWQTLHERQRGAARMVPAGLHGFLPRCA